MAKRGAIKTVRPHLSPNRKRSISSASRASVVSVCGKAAPPARRPPAEGRERWEPGRRFLRPAGFRRIDRPLWGSNSPFLCHRRPIGSPRRVEGEMAMRDLITGGAACAVPGSSSSSNPMGALANKLLGSSSKAQVWDDSEGEVVLANCWLLLGRNLLYMFIFREAKLSSSWSRIVVGSDELSLSKSFLRCYQFFRFLVVLISLSFYK